jgi:hypothetical protein
MEYVHHCVFCGWSRPGASPTILSPGCLRCGCPLRSSSLEDYEARDQDAEVPLAPRVPTRLLRVGALTVALLLVVVAVSAGWREGGFWIAVVGLGLGGLASLSLPYPAKR